MSRYSLGLYALRILDKEENEFLGLSKLKNGIDFFDQLEEFCKFLKNRGMQTHEELRLSVDLPDFKADKKARVIYGRLEKGSYGVEGNIYDIETKKVTYRKTKKDTTPEPYYFSIHLPENDSVGFAEKKAFLVFQRIGIGGVKTNFEDELKDFMKPFLSEFGYKMDLGAVSTTEFINQLIANAEIKQMRFISRHIPKDISRLSAKGTKEVEGKVELVVTASRGGVLPFNQSITQAIKKRANTSEIVSLSDINFEYTSVKMQVVSSGKERMIDIGGLAMSPYYAVDDSIKISEDGHPDLDALHQFALELVNEYKTQMKKETS